MAALRPPRAGLGLLRGLCSGAALGPMDRRETWDRFYARRDGATTHFDWFFSYEAVSGLLLRALETPSPALAPIRVLDVGCGTSDLGLGLYRDCPCPVHVCCVDRSPVAIGALRQLLRAAPPPQHPLSQLRLGIADGTALGATRGGRAGSIFHLVLDKGTCDALLRCPRGPGRAERLLGECLRVLRPGGCLLQFSDEDPDARIPFLEWAGGAGSVTVQEVGGHYYAYALRKPGSEGPAAEAPGVQGPCLEQPGDEGGGAGPAAPRWSC
ncbi:citrate synthase-lysine N-methyltransferase CSKMT, mitochondrial [Alligator mississippiensis]|uniref:citrate synthase-lysine N-methyltransferase CSKMT, mitochondrial n=1 Tax=Alligator mississippiensis TaxID=8496 RepID=UPI002877B061|nr:citrate synthase-lysine N-methyltransferase CSKMT, mitochondrial [Alligator mississippiensis]